MDLKERPEKENPESGKLSIDKDAQINVVVNHPDMDEATIDLGRVFHNMKVKTRVFAWVLVLCLLVGVSAPLLMYQFSKPMLTVSSVVTLNYEIARKQIVNGEEVITYSPVQDLTAPDGTELDLTQITSSYVLQNALQDLNLSANLSLKNLKDNIAIERVLTEDSRRTQEVASKMSEDKNSEVYKQMQEVEMKYEPKFLVTLKNGFGDEDSGSLKTLTDAELRIVLDRILSSYNDYLVHTYADVKLPDDEISVIDTEHLDILESLDLLRTAADNLYDYCDEKSDTVKAHRSWQTGRNLNDWMETLNTGREVGIEYLYSYVYTNSIVLNKDTMITGYEYQLRNAQTKLDQANENIATVQAILENYKNDEIFVSMQESDASKSTSTTTDYYNELILTQAKNYNDVAKLEITIADLQDKLANLRAETSVTDAALQEEAKGELQKVIATCKSIYESIRGHMEELFESSFYTDYAEHTAATGKLPSFISANLKKILIGGVVGIVVACGFWFLAGLAPEFRRGRKEEESGKEAAEK